MIFRNLNFDPYKDKRPVDQFGFVDLHEAAINGVIPANLEAQELRFNKIENPSEMRARPDDTFAAMRAEQYYSNLAASAESTENS